MKKPILLVGIVLVSACALAQVTPDGEFFRSLGDYLLKNGQDAAALSAYEKGLEMDSGNRNILNNLGYYYKDKDPLLAEEYFQKALQIDPDYETARSNLALLYNTLSDYENAIEELGILLEAHPDNVNYNYDIAINYADLFYYKTKSEEDLDYALEYFKKVYSMDQNFMYALQNINVLEEIKGE